MTRPWMLLCILAAGAAPAAAVTVESADGDWSKLPKLSQRGYDHLSEKMQAKLFEIADSRQCRSFVLKQGRLDFSVSFATQYSGDALDRLVLPKLDCPAAESVVAGALLAMLKGGDYAPTGKSAAGWYQGGLAFSFAGDEALSPAVASTTEPQVASNARDPNEIVCEKIEQIGSRLAVKRVCMSRAKWAEQRRLDRETVDLAQKTNCQTADDSC